MDFMEYRLSKFENDIADTLISLGTTYFIITYYTRILLFAGKTY